ncbi:MAG: RAD55 family ATPase [Thermoplasmatota archaeon]|jgi:KaiC/GvpD/RAD55 family RecA-like ATPase
MGIESKINGLNNNFLNNSIARISTGINRLDELLSGGLPSNSITLVSGSPGSGKTILCYHYLWQGLNNGEKCLFITSDERIANIVKQAKELGFDFKPWIEAGKIKFIYLDLDDSGIYKEIEEEIRSGNYTRVVLDSITPVSEVPVLGSGVYEINPSYHINESKKYPVGSIPATRMHVRRIMSVFAKNNCTALITSEVSGDTGSYSRDTVSEFLADGIIYLDLDTTMDRRKLTIRKMRSTKHTLKPQDIVITEGGIKFL